MPTDTFASFPTAYELGGLTDKLFATDACLLANDDILLAVFDQPNVDIEIWASADDGDTFSIRSTPWTASRQHPYIAHNGSTNVYVTVVGTSTNVYFKLSTDSGATWGSEVTVYGGGLQCHDPKIIYVNSSLLLCAFSLTTGGNHEIRVYSSTDDGSTWGSLSTALTVSTAGIANIEDIHMMVAGNGDILLFWEEESAESDHAICKMAVSTDDGATWGSPSTVYDDASNRADNEGGDGILIPGGTDIRYTFSTDEDDRTGTGTSPSYDKSKVKMLTSTDDGATWGSKTTLYDSFSNVESLTVFNALDEPILVATKGYWASGTTSLATVAVRNFGSYNFSDSDWTIDRGTAWVTKIGTDNVMRVHGYNHSTEPVVGGTGMRGWVSKNVTIADGEFEVDYRTSQPTNLDCRIGFRYTDAANHYMANITASSGGQIQVYKRVNNTYTLLNAVAHGGFSANTWYTLKVVLSGTSIKTYIGGVLKNDFTDATYSTGKIALGAGATAALFAPYYRNVVTPTPAATAYTFTGPSTGNVNVASTDFTVTPNGDADGITVTPASDGAGTFTPTSVTFTGSGAETFTYTPTSLTGSPHTLSVTDDGGLTDPASIDYTVTEPAATSYTFAGPSSGVVNVASSNFTVTPNGDADGITVTPASDGTGTFDPASVTFTGSGAETFTYTPTDTAGSPHTLSVTDDGGLTDPASIDYTVNDAGAGGEYNPWYMIELRLTP